MTNAEARFNKIHIRKVYACLAVTWHLHFWQNDRDFLRATVVTRGWNGYRNKSQHRKSTLEKKILPPFQQGFEPATFQSRVRRSNHWAILAPRRVHKFMSIYIWKYEANHCPPTPFFFLNRILFSSIRVTSQNHLHPQALCYMYNPHPSTPTTTKMGTSLTHRE